MATGRLLAAGVLAAIAVASCGGGPGSAPTITLPATTLPATVPGAASQSVDAAVRDGVLPELAALPMDQRVVQFADDFGPTRIEASEGVWMISRPAPNIPGLLGGCILGDSLGLYGRDYLCTSDYGEIVLLDQGTGDIVRAYPFPTVYPQVLELVDDALYCIRQGDGGSPDSMMCRIDRSTLEATVRVFPSSVDSAFGDLSDIYVPENWTVDVPTSLVLWQRLAVTDVGIRIEGISGSGKVNPATLEILEVVEG